MLEYLRDRYQVPGGNGEIDIELVLISAFITFVCVLVTVVAYKARKNVTKNEPPLVPGLPILVRENDPPWSTHGFFLIYFKSILPISHQDSLSISAIIFRHIPVAAKACLSEEEFFFNISSQPLSPQTNL